MSAIVRALKAVPSTKMDIAIAVGPGKATVPNWLRFVARDPFCQLMVLGLLIWSGSEYWNAHNNRFEVTIGPAERQRIATTYLQQFGQVPTSDQLQGLIDRYIREEIFFREGVALHLEKDDEIVRRRIAQKYEFLQADLATPDSPTPAALEDWFDRNKPRYIRPERVAFAHVYFSLDKSSEKASEARALKVLALLRHTHVSRAPSLGDSFPGPSDVGSLGPDEAERLFGESDLSRQLFKLPVAQWSGPFRSGYGWHLVRVTGRFPPVLPPLREVRERVLADYLDEQRRILNVQAFERLRAKYTIRDGGGAR